MRMQRLDSTWQQCEESYMDVVLSVSHTYLQTYAFMFKYWVLLIDVAGVEDYHTFLLSIFYYLSSLYFCIQLQ
jgi:hypothetical protein